MVKKLSVRSLGGLLGLTLWCGLVAQPLLAAEAGKPVAVVSVASVDRLAQDLGYLARAAGRGDVGVYLQWITSSFLETLDRTRPAGVLITVDQDDPRGVGFLPVPDPDALLRVMRDRLGAKVDELSDGVRKLELGKGVYLKQQGPWLFFSDHPRNLAELPDDPVAQLDGLDQRYAVAARFYLRNIPQAQKDVADFLLQSKIDSDIDASLRDNPDADAALLESLRKQMKKASSTIIHQLDQVTIGWAVDGTQQRTYVDLRVQAEGGSSLAQQFQPLGETRSTFTGFLMPDAAAAVQGCWRVSPAAEQKLSSFWDYVREKTRQGLNEDPSTPADIKETIDDILDVVARTLRECQADVGATLMLAPASFRFVGGARVADGQALANALQQLWEQARQDPEVPPVHFFAGRLEGLDLHTLNLPIAATDQDARRLFGEHLEMTVATGPEQLYVALGPGSDGLLKEVVARSAELGSQKVSPLHLRVALMPVMRFLASIEPDAGKQRSLTAVIDQAQGGDVIDLVVQPVQDGLELRVSVEDGVLGLIGAASRAAQSTR